MKKQLKRLIAMLVIALCGVCAHAATPAFNVLCINRTDGATEHLLLHKEMRLSLSAEGNLRITHPAVTVEIPCNEVATFTVIEDSSITDVYDGSHSGIAETELAPKVSITSTAITASESITLYDLRGAKVASAAAVNGPATLPISSLAKGVYIVKAGQTTLKVTL